MTKQCHAGGGCTVIQTLDMTGASLLLWEDKYLLLDLEIVGGRPGPFTTSQLSGQGATCNTLPFLVMVETGAKD